MTDDDFQSACLTFHKVCVCVEVEGTKSARGVSASEEELWQVQVVHLHTQPHTQPHTTTHTHLHPHTTGAKQDKAAVTAKVSRKHGQCFASIGTSHE